MNDTRRGKGSLSPSSLPRDLELRLIDALGYEICTPDDIWTEVSEWMEVNRLHLTLRSASGVTETEAQATYGPVADRRPTSFQAELQHRTLNLLGLVQIIARRSQLSSPTLPEFVRDFDGQLAALARTNRLMASLGDGELPTVDALLDSLMESLGPDLSGTANIILAGIDGIALPAEAVQILGLTLYDLLSESRDFGALHSASGQLSIDWRISDSTSGRALLLEWVELAGPAGPDLRPAPGRAQQMVEEGLPHQLGATTAYRWSKRSLTCSIALPLTPGSDGFVDGGPGR